MARFNLGAVTGARFCEPIVPRKWPRCEPYREVARIVQQPDVRERLLQMGMDPLATPPGHFGAEIKEAVVRWPPIVKAAGIRR